jgi:glycosyltransferase involved in cell wall biosynthesis
MARFKTLSIIIPVYNEAKTLTAILSRVESQAVPLKKEIILVDDCSKDGTRRILKRLEKTGNYKIAYHSKNQGKGAAVRTGLSRAAGDIVLIQDADLEYDPGDYPKLLQPILDGKTEVVYGNRFWKTRKGKHFTYRLHTLGNKGLSVLTSILFFSSVHDMETCYKVFTRKVLKKLPKLHANRFELEPEITAKILKSGFRILEVPIKYNSRDFDEGKKITWKDGLKAAYYLVKYRIVN